MSLPIFSPTRALGDYLWEFATQCVAVAERWEAKGMPESVSGIRRFADELLSAEADIAECRLGLWLDGRWNYQTDGYR